MYFEYAIYLITLRERLFWDREYVKFVIFLDRDYRECYSFSQSFFLSAIYILFHFFGFFFFCFFLVGLSVLIDCTLVRDSSVFCFVVEIKYPIR